jgi:hypothetical protein
MPHEPIAQRSADKPRQPSSAAPPNAGHALEDASGTHCPRCGGGDVRRSRARGLFDRVVKVFGFVPLRCGACRARYLSPAAPGAESWTRH